jgi:CspA family cold shock protein
MGGEELKGKIKTLIQDRGFGFLTTETGKDVFFHRSDLVGVDFEALREGIGVQFDLRMTPKGPQAVNVTSGMTLVPVVTLQAYARPYMEQIEQLRQERNEALARVAALERELGRLEEQLKTLLQAQRQECKSWSERLLGR